MEIELHDLFWTMDTQEIKDMGSVLWVQQGGFHCETFGTLCNKNRFCLFKKMNEVAIFYKPYLKAQT